MDDLKRLEGKTIQEINNDSDGTNSYMIIKFKEGDRLNITSYINGDEGVAELDIETGGLKVDDIIGKRIQSIVEEFDGENDYLILNFKEGGKITVTSFSSSEESTAGLSASLHSTKKLVPESLNEMFENKYEDARNGQYPMYKPQYENEEEDEEDNE